MEKAINTGKKKRAKCYALEKKHLQGQGICSEMVTHAAHVYMLCAYQEQGKG